MKVIIKNNTGYDIKECTITFMDGLKVVQKELSWFEDGDIIETRPGYDIAPRLTGYIEDDYGRDTLVEGEARVAAKAGVTVTKWVFNKVHECD